jgi:lipase ATG15
MLHQLLPALALLARFTASDAIESSQTFTLRHVHETHADSGRIRWSDISENTIASSLSSGTLSYHSDTRSHVLYTRPMNIPRPISQAAFHAHRRKSRKSRKRRREASIFVPGDSDQSLGWEEHEVEGPMTDKRETLLALAKMTNNAYFKDGQVGWYELGGNWTNVSRICPRRVPWCNKAPGS